MLNWYLVVCHDSPLAISSVAYVGAVKCRSPHVNNNLQHKAPIQALTKSAVALEPDLHVLYRFTIFHTDWAQQAAPIIASPVFVCVMTCQHRDMRLITRHVGHVLGEVAEAVGSTTWLVSDTKCRAPI